MEQTIARALRENWFWTGVLSDHAQFIHDNLAPGQEEPIRQAAGFHRALDTLRTQARELARAAGLPGPAGSRALTADPSEPLLAGLQGQELLRLERQAQQLNRATLEAARSIRAFKQELLQQKLDCTVILGLSPTLLAHTIVEAEEAMRTLARIGDPKPVPPALESLHHHLIWLPDAAGHAAALHSGADKTEQEILQTTQNFQGIFDGMHIKALELYSMLRVAPRMVGALRRLNRDAVGQIAAFRTFLAELREHLEGCEVLGSLVPLFADHMLREELYYTEKLLAIPAD